MKMKDTKLEMHTGEKEKRKEEKRKIIKGNAPLIKKDKVKNNFFDYRYISEKDSIYEVKKGNIKNNKKRNRIIKKRIYI